MFRLVLVAFWVFYVVEVVFVVLGVGSRVSVPAVACILGVSVVLGVVLC